MNKITSVQFKTGEKTIEPDDVLEKAKGNYTSVLVVGWDNEGFLDVRFRFSTHFTTLRHG